MKWMPAFCRPGLFLAAPMEPAQQDQVWAQAWLHARAGSRACLWCAGRSLPGRCGAGACSSSRPELAYVEAVCYLAGVLVGLCKAARCCDGGQGGLLGCVA